jgi:hypothetical protein
VGAHWSILAQGNWTKSGAMWRELLIFFLFFCVLNHGTEVFSQLRWKRTDSLSAWILST